MTREEAIEVLNTYDMSEDNEDTEFKDALALAIKALEQEPCEDEYIKVPKKALKYRTAGMVAYNAEWLKNHFDMERAVICGAQEPCEDAVSRTNLLKQFEDGFIELQKAHRKDLQFGINWCINTLLDAPSVTPIHKDRTTQDFTDRCRECGKTAITRAENEEILNEAWSLLMNVSEEDGVTTEQANGMLKLMNFFFYKYHGLKKKPDWVENVEARMEESEE